MVKAEDAVTVVLALKKEELQPIKNEQEPVAEPQLNKKVREQTLRDFPRDP